MDKYKLTRSRRKSISICIERDGTVQVKAPDWLPRSQIEEFVQKKSAWIERKRIEIKALEQKRIFHTYEEGDRFRFLGEEYSLQIRQHPFLQKEDSRMGMDLDSVSREGIALGRSASESFSRENFAKGRGVPESLSGESLAQGRDDSESLSGESLVQGKVILRLKEKILSITLPSVSASEVKGQLEQWYLLQAEKIFPERVAVYYPTVAESARAAIPKGIGAVNHIAIRSQKTRWGSCSSKGNLNFNWRLLMAPLEILDYVVVHELCHLAYLNHSPQFWQLVGDILSDYAQRRRWLKENGMLLQWEEG